MEKLQHDLEDLHREMRSTNVRSHGLKVGTHETWCSRVENLVKRVTTMRESGSPATERVPPPPPPVPS